MNPPQYPVTLAPRESLRYTVQFAPLDPGSANGVLTVRSNAANSPVEIPLYNYRHGLRRCPFGHRWIISTRVEDVSDEEVKARWNNMLDRREI